MAFIDESRQMTVISLGLCIVNLRCGGRQRHKGARLSELELWRVPAAGGWSRGRRCAWLSSLCRSWVLITSIAGVVMSSMFTEWWVSLLISSCTSWCPRFPPRFPASGSPHRAGPGGAEGLEGLREVLEVWQCSSLIGVAGCLGWTSDGARLKGTGEDAI
jgi:hypothetical protein